MKLIDRISLNRLINTLFNFIVTITKIFVHKEEQCDNTDKKIRRRRRKSSDK